MKLALALSIALLPSVLSAQELDLGGTFARLQQAQQQLRFQGTLVYRSGDQLEVFQIAPGSLRSDQDVRLLQLVQSQIQVDRGGIPSSLPRLQWHADAPPSNVYEQIRLHYAISAEPTSQVGGRPALPVRFEPRDGWRFAQTLWMDQASGLLLKSELREGTRVLAQSMLLDVKLMEAAVALQADPPASQSPVLASLATLQGMPDGFYVMRHAAQGAQQQWLVGDGLSAISVFVEPVQGDGQRGEARRGAMLSVAEVRYGYQLVAVGAAPGQTLNRLLSGVSLAP